MFEFAKAYVRLCARGEETSAAEHRFVSTDPHSVVKTSRAHEVLKWDTAGVEHCNCGPIKTSVCVHLCVCVCVCSCPGPIKVLSCVSWGLVVERRITLSKVTCVTAP